MNEYETGTRWSIGYTPKKHDVDYPSNFLDYLIPFYSGQKPTLRHINEKPLPPFLPASNRGEIH